MKVRILLITCMIALCCSVFYACTNADASIASKSPPEIVTQTFQPEAIVSEVRIYNPKIMPILINYANLLEQSGSLYNWSEASTCNIGLLAQLTCNLNAKEVSRKLITDYKDLYNNTVSTQSVNWKDIAIQYCGITNKPTYGIIGELQKLGFTSADIGNLEFLSDPVIAKRTGLKELKKHNLWHLIKYVRTWAEIIKEQQKDKNLIPVQRPAHT